MARLTDVQVEFVSFVNRAAVRNPGNPTEPQTFLLWKADSGASTEGGNTMTDIDKSADDLRAELTKAQEELAAANAKVEELEKASKPEPEAETVNKDELTPAVRTMVEKAEADAKAAAERAEKAEVIAKAERDLRIEKEFIAKAEKDFGRVGGDAERFGKLLKASSESLSKEDFEALETVLKAADARIASGDLFREYGAAGDGVPEESRAAADEITRKAEELRKSDPSLTEYDALLAAARSDKATQLAHLASVR